MTEPSPGQRVARTAAQGGLALAVVVITEWALLLAGADLDPGPGQGLPLPVSAAFQGLLTTATAFAMNRRSKPDLTPDPHQKEAVWPTS